MTLPLRYIRISLLALVLVAHAGADPSGMTGRTLKSTRAGCSCHATAANAAVLVSISGPDTVVSGQTATYTLHVSGGPAVNIGCDIAVKYGVLAAIATQLKRSGVELTHRNPIVTTNGSVALDFKYTAPANRTSDTLFATGNSVNGNGNSSGDSWNWAPNKHIFISTTATTIDQTGVAERGFSLDGNFPNPLRGATTFRFSIASTSFTTLKVFNLQGAEVSTVLSDFVDAGTHSIAWNAGRLPAGVYLYRLQAGLYSETRKLLVTE